MEPEDATHALNQIQGDQAQQRDSEQRDFEQHRAGDDSPESRPQDAGRPEAHPAEMPLPGAPLPEAALEDRFDSNYRYVLVAARRARQIQRGSPPLVATHSTKACRVARDEIAAGLVKYIRLPSVEHPKTSEPGPLVNTYSSYR